MKTLPINTKKRNQFIDITKNVEDLIRQTDIKQGVCVVFCPHTTAGLTINENADPAVARDITAHLEKLIPCSEKYTHSEGNSDAHIKASLLGSSLNIIIDNAKLVLGTWQGIYFAEFDGPRNRSVYVKVIRG